MRRDVTIRYSHLGEAYRDLDDAKKAIAHYGQALAIDSNGFGDKHPHSSFFYSYLDHRDLHPVPTRRSFDLYEQALAIDSNVFGEQHPNVAISYNNLGAA